MCSRSSESWRSPRSGWSRRRSSASRAMTVAHDFEYTHSERADRRRSFAIAGVFSALLALAGLGIWQLLKDAGARKKKEVKQIPVVQPKELPKPPPEPEKPKEEVKEKIQTPPPEAK